MPATQVSRVGRVVKIAVGGEIVRAYVPPPLPPRPAIDVAPLMGPLARAERALGRLDGVATLLPRPELILYMHVRKEAVLSSQIEGTQSTLADLLRFESEARAGRPLGDVREVSNYVDATMHALKRLEKLPLSLRLIREAHARLMKGARGGAKAPGEFRRSQNWIGGTRPGNALFVPPPVSDLAACLDAFERYLHDDAPDLPPLVKSGLIHVQFETIHPFLDGNGRIGRLLVALYLREQGVLGAPILYLSLYLKKHRATYYRLLQAVRERGAWEEWLAFFLDGVAETADQAVGSSTRMVALFRRDRERIVAAFARPDSALRVHDRLQDNPFATPSALARGTSLTLPTVNAALAGLVEAGIVREVTGRRRGRVFAYRAYLDILDEGTAPA